MEFVIKVGIGAIIVTAYSGVISLFVAAPEYPLGYWESYPHW